MGLALAACLFAASAWAFPLWLDSPVRNNPSDPKSLKWDAPRILTATPVPATPTRTPTPGLVVNAVGATFSPSSASIGAGDPVVFTASFNGGHTVHFDDGTLSGACATDYVNGFPRTLTFTPGIYKIHCDVHSSCGASVCAGCGGMTMTLVVN